MSADPVIELSPLVKVVGVSHRGLESAEVVRVRGAVWTMARMPRAARLP